VNKIVNRFGFTFQRSGLGYYSAKDVVSRAKSKNLSVCQFLESVENTGEGQKGRRDAIIDSIRSVIPVDFRNGKILEIGTGTGIFMEKFLDLYSPSRYESYETDVGWAAYLQSEYSKKVTLINRKPNGFNLEDTDSEEMDLVVAHGVFVYLQLIQSIGYLYEMVRTCKSGGLIIFDCYLSESLSTPLISKFREKNKYFPVFMPQKLIEDFAVEKKLQLIHSFNVGYHESYSTYFIFKKLERPR
jgi:phospholipid N-methyltransferase